MEKQSVFNFCILCFLLTLDIINGSFDISDDTLFSINWPELSVSSLDSDNYDIISMKTTNSETYDCSIPHDIKSKYEHSDEGEYVGPSEMDLLQPFFQQTACSYKMESYWTYELCHGRHLRQYHEEKVVGNAVKLQEYYLGRAAAKVIDEQQAEAKSEHEDGSEKSTNKVVRKPPTLILEGTTYAYFAINMSDGTPCDLTNEPRRTSVLYICHNEGRGELYEVTETESCQYRVVVLSKSLCQHPAYKSKEVFVNQIQCRAREGHPNKPINLFQLENDKNVDLRNQIENLQSMFGAETEVIVKQDGNKIVVQVRKKGTQPAIIDVEHDTTTTATTTTTTMEGQQAPLDSTNLPPAASLSSSLVSHSQAALLRQFFNGDYCVVGGSGWWRHELCYGKYARQFHDDNATGRTVILLGKWIPNAHKRWLSENERMRPSSPPSQRRDVWYMYSGGDYCDLIAQPRMVQVRLRCSQDGGTSIAIMLQEPQSCKYVLTVEGALFCPLVRAADEDGFVRNIEDLFASNEPLASKKLVSTSQSIDSGKQSQQQQVNEEVDESFLELHQAKIKLRKTKKPKTGEFSHDEEALQQHLEMLQKEQIELLKHHLQMEKLQKESNGGAAQQDQKAADVVDQQQQQQQQQRLNDDVILTVKVEEKQHARENLSPLEENAADADFSHAEEGDKVPSKEESAKKKI